MIPIASLAVTQHGLRCPGQVPAMTRFAHLGGRFTRDALLAFSVIQGKGAFRPMRLAFLPDGKVALCDGLHRAVAIHLAGRDALDDDEYVASHLAYEDFSKPDLGRGWYTPFDLHTEVRRPDFGGFRNNVALRVTMGQPAEDVGLWVEANRGEYAQARRYWTVAEAASEYAAPSRLAA